VVGGGFGGLQAAIHLARGPVQLTLVDRRNFHLFQPLAYQVATGSLSPAEVCYPLRTIFSRRANVRVLMAEVSDFDLDARELHLSPVGGVPAPSPQVQAVMRRWLGPPRRVIDLPARLVRRAMAPRPSAGPSEA